jgi:hypothetical protein
VVGCYSENAAGGIEEGASAVAEDDLGAKVRRCLPGDPTIVEPHARRDDEPASDRCCQKVERVVVEGIEDGPYARFSSHANYQRLQVGLRFAYRTTDRQK